MQATPATQEKPGAQPENDGPEAFFQAPGRNVCDMPAGTMRQPLHRRGGDGRFGEGKSEEKMAA